MAAVLGLDESLAFWFGDPRHCEAQKSVWVKLAELFAADGGATATRYRVFGLRILPALVVRGRNRCIDLACEVHL